MNKADKLILGSIIVGALNIIVGTYDETYPLTGAHVVLTVMAIAERGGEQ